LAIADYAGFILRKGLRYRISGKARELSFTTQIIFYGFLISIGVATAAMYPTESASTLSFNHSPMLSFFQTMSAVTTVGFNTIPIDDLILPVVLVIAFLLDVGASLPRTVGVLKDNALNAQLSILKSR
jgi:trk system potassium uptake protein TrkH